MATQVETAIAKGKSLLGSHNYDNYCQRFVRVCYEAAGIYGSALSAREACNKWKVSGSKTNIPVGAAVYFFNSSDGHVGIYLGNNQMIHAWGGSGVIISSIDICSNYQGWGWQAGIEPTGAGVSVSDALYSDGGSSTSFNIEKKSTATIPEFNKADKVSLMELDKNKGLCLKIIHENTIYDVTELCYDSIQLVTKRKANPGKLTFKIARDLIPSGGVEFYEGDAVALMYDDVGMFWGYIFSKSRTKEQIITVTAYDQTRYLKNKETYCYTKTASEVVKMICEDFNLQMGEIADTGYTINERVEDNSTLWDIIYNAIDFTNIYTGKYYELYDDFGDITLKAIDENILPLALVSSDNTLIDFSYKTDIDTNSYNRVVLYRDNKDTGTREIYEAQDTVNEMKWGILQYTEKVSDNYTEEQIINLCNQFIEMYNKVNRTFSVEDKGNPNVRAGCGIWVQIDDVGEVINAGAMVESCTHTFKNGEHTMKLEITCEEAVE